MRHITTFTGTVLEVQRFINTESRRWERYVCRERRELWLSDGQSDEQVRHSHQAHARQEGAQRHAAAG